jgi:hypothetical protein
VPDEWWENPPAHGILTATSGNYWHVWAMEQIATHFGLPALAFMQQQVAWLAADDLKALHRDLAVLRRAFAAGEVFADPWAVRFETAASNRVAFEDARVTLEVQVEDTQENFFAFFKAPEDRVSHALSQNLSLLYFRY